ncbi:MAG: hypothetical protein ACREO0_00305 [Pseudoxanthomonas sp.]
MTAAQPFGYQAEAAGRADGFECVSKALPWTALYRRLIFGVNSLRLPAPLNERSSQSGVENESQALHDAALSRRLRNRVRTMT